MFWFLARLMAGPLLSPDGDEGGNSTEQSTDASKTKADDKPESKTDAEKPKISAETQALIDSAAAAARKEGEAAGKRAASEEAKKKAQEEEAKAKGEWEKLATDRGTEVETLKAELAKRDLADLRRTIGAKHKLPADATDRLRGTTEAELDADAKELAKLIGAREAPNTEAGAGSKGQGQKGGGEQGNGAAKTEVAAPKVIEGVPIVAWPE